MLTAQIVNNFFNIYQMKLIKLFEEYNDEYYTEITVDVFTRLDIEMIRNLSELTPIEEVEAEWLKKTLLDLSEDKDFSFCYYDQKEEKKARIVNNKEYKSNKKKSSMYLHQRWLQNRVLGLSLKHKPSFIIIKYKKPEDKFSETTCYIDIVKLGHENYLARYEEVKNKTKRINYHYFRCEGLFGLRKLLKNIVANK